MALLKHDFYPALNIHKYIFYITRGGGGGGGGGEK